MVIWGKVVGSLIGLVLYGPVGLVLGLVFGQIFDNGLRSVFNAPVHPEEVRHTFFKSVFLTMGYIAKVDGVVSENEIRVAREIMLHDFQLNRQQMLLAIDYFNQGKSPAFNLQNTLQKFKDICGRYADLRRFFLELQVKAAMADKVLSEFERGRLVYICSSLNIPIAELDYYLQSYGYTYYQYNTYTHTANKVPENELSAAYQLLGVKPSDSLKTIKSAYRKLISKYHPDKLVAKGLPEEMMNIAKEKTQKITVAYDLILRKRTQ